MNNGIVEKTVKVRVYSAALASNMASLSNGRSIGGLRADMGAAGYKIGQGTLERIYKGDKGVRMESLEKVADYFGTEVDQLMRDTANAALTAPNPTVSATGGQGLSDTLTQLSQLVQSADDLTRDQLKPLFIRMLDEPHRAAEIVQRIQSVISVAQRLDSEISPSDGPNLTAKDRARAAQVNQAAQMADSFDPFKNAKSKT